MLVLPDALLLLTLLFCAASQPGSSVSVVVVKPRSGILNTMAVFFFFLLTEITYTIDVQKCFFFLERINFMKI